MIGQDENESIKDVGGFLRTKKTDGLKIMDGGGEPISVKHPLKALLVGCFPDGRGEIHPEDFTLVNDETQRRAEESLPPPTPPHHPPPRPAITRPRIFARACKMQFIARGRGTMCRLEF